MPPYTSFPSIFFKADIYCSIIYKWNSFHKIAQALLNSHFKFIWEQEGGVTFTPNPGQMVPPCKIPEKKRSICLMIIRKWGVIEWNNGVVMTRPCKVMVHLNHLTLLTWTQMFIRDYNRKLACFKSGRIFIQISIEIRNSCYLLLKQ